LHILNNSFFVMGKIKFFFQEGRVKDTAIGYWFLAKSGLSYF